MSAFNRPTMRRFVNCEDNGEPSLRDGESISYTLSDVGVSFRNEDPIVATVRLIVTTGRIILMGETLSLDIDVSYVTLHAVTRDPDSYAQPCVYCQLDCEEDDDDDDESDQEPPPQLYPTTEMFLVPSDVSDLKEIFNAFSHAALLNPDPPEDGEEEGDDELIYNTDEVELGAEQSRNLQHLESVFHLPGDELEIEGEEEEEEETAGQFEDAAEE